MSTFDGPFPEMPDHHDVLTLDDGTAERLLRGVLTLDDAPPAYREVVVLFAALNAPPTPRELAGERRMVPFIARRITESASVTRVTPTTRITTRKRSPHRLRVAVLAVVAAATLLMSLASAGALPGAAQRVASDVLGQVGISVPSPNGHSDGHADTSGTSGTTGASSSDAKDKGATVSDAAHSASTDGGKGSEVSPIASDGKSQAGLNGQNGDAQNDKASPSDTRPSITTPEPPTTSVDPNANGDQVTGATASEGSAPGNQP
jgi:hypothetical protein